MHPFLISLNIISLKDCLEILFFTFIFFKFCRWLKQDQKSNLVGHFYLASTIYVGAYAFDLYAITQFYHMTWPIMLTLFIILHQKSLQKNYVAARTLHSKEINQNSWAAHILSAAFKGLQYKKNFTFIIEGNDSLDEFISKPIELCSPIQPSLLTMIVESNLTQPNSIIQLSQYGKILGLNGQWQKKMDPLWLDKKHENYYAWEQEALYWSHHLDALIFQANAQTKTLTFIAHGTRISSLTPDKATTLIDQYLKKNKLPHQIKQTHQEGASV
jgi:hypothetical protein